MITRLGQARPGAGTGLERLSNKKQTNGHLLRAGTNEKYQKGRDLRKQYLYKQPYHLSEN